MRRQQLATPVVVVVVTGALDGPALDTWRQRIDEAVASQPVRLVVDLTACASIDAAAIVFLLQVHRRLICADAQLVLRRPDPRVRRMLNLTHVDKVFDIEMADGEGPGSPGPIR